MGEEWGATTRFPFFCDFGTELAEKVREGRKAEFSGFPEFQNGSWDELPDPLSRETFLSAKLDWTEADRNRDRIDWYRQILAVRRRHVSPLHFEGRHASWSVHGPSALSVEWRAPTRTRLCLEANLSENSCSWPHEPVGRAIWREGEAGPGGRGPWSVIWQLVEDRSQ
jgi:1,4-alpha-glucan branching enzyme